MKRVHLGRDLVDESLKELIDGIRDGLTVIDDGVNEPEEVVGKRTIGGFVGVEEEMRDVHAKTGLFRG